MIIDTLDAFLIVKKPQNGRMKAFTDKQATTNVRLIFLIDKMLKHLHQSCF